MTIRKSPWKWTTIAAVLLIITSCISHTKSQTDDADSCRTPNGLRGICRNIKTCELFVNILKNRPIPPESYQLLQRSTCGYEGNDPKVCCPRKSEVMATPSPIPTREPSPIPTRPPTPSPRPTLVDRFYNEPPPDISNHQNIDLLPKRCGNGEEDKLFGGNRTGIFEFPWMALLSYRTTRGVRFHCGGSIIHSRYILTAAHCITQLDRRELIGVRVGEHNLNTEEDCEPGYPEPICAPSYQNMGIEEIVPHPMYVGGRGANARYQHDIGLLRLSEPINMTYDNALPVCLPVTQQLQQVNLTQVIITGWGATEDGPSSPELLKISIPIMDNLQCGRVLNESVRDGIGFRQICAGGVLNVDACSGDSGGPLVALGVINSISRYVQHGIVSFGSKNCGRQGVPGVYTKIAHYMDWILDNLRP